MISNAASALLIIIAITEPSNMKVLCLCDHTRYVTVYSDISSNVANTMDLSPDPSY